MLELGPHLPGRCQQLGVHEEAPLPPLLRVGPSDDLCIDDDDGTDGELAEHHPIGGDREGLAHPSIIVMRDIHPFSIAYVSERNRR
ncbi:MAG TPA: hypothetical protein VNL12_19540 [Iamia sp.]|nr:hypothetical protein [Iamia sp.]HXH59485.1 hypothetical protein [Iamia sp.]